MHQNVHLLFARLGGLQFSFKLLSKRGMVKHACRGFRSILTTSRESSIIIIAYIFADKKAWTYVSKWKDGKAVV